jgi:hypothetical protein
MKVTKAKENFKRICRNVKLFWNAGYQFIPILIATSVIFFFMYYNENGYYLVKKNHSVAIDSVTIISVEMDSTIVSLTNSAEQDSAIVRMLTREAPKDDSKGSYLSLWAAALAVIFVVFSIFGVLKLELTKEDIEKKYETIKNEEKSISKLKKIQKIYQELFLNVNASLDDDDILRDFRIGRLANILDNLKTIEADPGENKLIESDKDERINSILDLYMSVLNMKKINERELSKRSDIIIKQSEEIKIEELKQDKVKVRLLCLLGMCYYNKYIETHNIEDLHHSIDAYCILCQEKEIYDMLNNKKHYFNYVHLKSEQGLYKYELCQILYDYPEEDGDRTKKEYALKCASKIMCNLIKNI